VLEHATAAVSLQATNCVTGVTILADRLALSPLAAGAACVVPVRVATENGARPDAEAAAHCATLRVIAPGGSSRNAQARARLPR